MVYNITLSQSFIKYISIITFIIYGKLKNLDEYQINTITGLKSLSKNILITIEKENEIRYLHNVTGLTNHCLDQHILHIDNIKLNYQSCMNIDTGYQYKLIPTSSKIEQNEILNPIKKSFHSHKIKPYAPHYIILEDVALYGHGDLMTLDGTSHYLGVCRHLQAHHDNMDVNVKRSDVAQFIEQPVFNLVTLWTESYFNTFIAYLPRYFSLIQIIKNNPNIIVIKNLFRTRTEVVIEPILEYYGLRNSTKKIINFMNIEYGKVYFIKYLIAPLSNCRFISKNSIHMIRKAVYDIYNLNKVISQNLIIITDRRDFDPIVKKLNEIYGDEIEIIRYNPVLDVNGHVIRSNLHKIFQMFSKCKVFITTEHSDDSVNIMFMNKGANVIEIRSDQSSSWLSSYLSSVIKATYYSTLTENKQIIHRATKQIQFDVNKLISIITYNLLL